MQLKEYAKLMNETAIYPKEQGVVYCALGLAGEVGEVTEHIKKSIRDDAGNISPTRLVNLRKELGDVAWYWVRLCIELGFDPEEVLQVNVEKLLKRKEEGKLQGSGSDR